MDQGDQLGGWGGRGREKEEKRMSKTEDTWLQVPSVRNQDNQARYGKNWAVVWLNTYSK